MEGEGVCLFHVWGMECPLSVSILSSESRWDTLPHSETVRDKQDPKLHSISVGGCSSDFIPMEPIYSQSRVRHGPWRWFLRKGRWERRLWEQCPSRGSVTVE